MRRVFAIVLGCVLATASSAQAPETSLRPVARPGTVEAPTPQAMATIAFKVVRPRAAPDRPVRIVQPARPAMIEASRPSGRLQQEAARAVERHTRTGNALVARDAPPQQRIGLLRSLRPLLRPPEVGTRAVARRQQLVKGSICGDPDIQGSVVGTVPGRVAGCGVENAVKVRAINGIMLSQQAVMDCVTAKTLKQWIRTGLTPAVGSTGGGVAKLRVAAHYVCRTRNHQKGAKISEHGKGRAVDIAAIQLRDGSEISVLKDWGRGHNGRILHDLHKTACGPFGTVLGPNSDSFHRDHFHFDTARYRSGSYCR